MKFKQLLNKTGMTLKKHSPAIFTGVGIVGLGATAYLAYKSREKVEEVVENIEETREQGLEIDKVQVVKDISEAVYLPVLVGVASMTSIFMSYRIQNRRIAVLAGSLAAQQARNIFFENRYRKLHGDEAFAKFQTPTDEIYHETTNDKGKTKVTVEEIKKDVDSTIGKWYSDSTEYASDDHTYNMAYIDSVEERLQTLLFQRGSLLLNEVLEALGFERTRAGALLGWTTGDSFRIDKVVTNLGKEDEGELLEQTWVTWSHPRYIHDEVEFNGRYSIY